MLWHLYGRIIAIQVILILRTFLKSIEFLLRILICFLPKILQLLVGSCIGTSYRLEFIDLVSVGIIYMKLTLLTTQIDIKCLKLFLCHILNYKQANNSNRFNQWMR